MPQQQILRIFTINIYLQFVTFSLRRCNSNIVGVNDERINNEIL
jgi:hypothetical protein